MSETDALFEETEQDINRIGVADVVIGLPTYNNRETIDGVVEAALAGLANHLSSRRSAIINADGASKDGTPERLRELSGERIPLIQVRYPMYPVHRLSAPVAGVPGRREALRTILLLARKVSAKVCTVLDADIESIGPEWMPHLTDPVLNDEFDLVTPNYQRGRFDGAINSGIVYPFLRALYGRRIRQPVGGDMAFSAPLIDHLAGAAAAEPPHSPTMEPQCTTAAILGHFKICQAFLGPRVLRTKVTSDVSELLAQVLSALFEEMDRTAAFWQKIRGSEPVPTFGPSFSLTDETAPPNTSRMIESFQLGYQALRDIWSLVLPPATLLEFQRMCRRPEADFRMSDDVWARTVYDFALGYRLRVIDRDHLLRAMTPAYLGWFASFAGEMQAASSEEIEQRIERLAVAFETQKRYLISRWRWPDRFSP